MVDADEWDEWSAHSEGCYVLRTNITDWTPEALWRTLSNSPKPRLPSASKRVSCRSARSGISVRPGVLAHILVCFLAYVLWKTLEQWQSRAGLCNSPRTILQELAAISSTDLVLPIAVAPPRDLRLRCVVRPDRAQAALLDRLGLHLPERLRVRLA